MYQGFETETAENGLEAVNLLKANPKNYLAVLMDLRMPIMDGITATRTIRTELKLSIPIIILSAEPDDCLSAGKSEGANAVLGKPTGAIDILNVLRTFGIEGQPSL